MEWKHTNLKNLSTASDTFTNKFYYLTFSFVDNKLIFDFVIPHLFISSTYELKGKILMLAIDAKGFFKSNSSINCLRANSR